MAEPDTTRAGRAAREVSQTDSLDWLSTSCLSWRRLRYTTIRHVLVSVSRRITQRNLETANGMNREAKRKGRRISAAAKRRSEVL